MSKKIICTVLSVILLTFVFSSCKDTGKSQTPSQKSDEDTLTVGDDFEFMSEQAALSDAAKAAGALSEFNKLLSDADRTVAAYYGADDVTLGENDYSGKTVSVNTTGSLTVNSAVESIVAENANKGITVNAYVKSLLIRGENITVDVTADTGSIYIEGKNATINVSEKLEKIVTVNSTAVIVNKSENDLSVYLANGTKVTVPAKNTYLVKPNEITKNAEE